MTSISQAAVAASVLVGLVSVPAVSQTAPPKNSMETAIPNVSTEDAGREVVKSVSPDGFEAEISTAFEKFTTRANPERANATLQTPTSDLRMEKTSKGAEWKLATARGALTVKRSHDSVTEITETPEGTLKVVREDGATTRKFRGSDRSAVEEARERLHNRLEEKKQQMDDRREELEPEKKVSIRINSSLADGYGNNTEEHALIINEGKKAYNLDGWTVKDDDGNYQIEDEVVEPDEKLRVYSSSEEDVSFNGKAVYGAMAWTNGGTQAILLDSDGEKVDESSF